MVPELTALPSDIMLLQNAFALQSSAPSSIPPALDDDRLADGDAEGTSVGLLLGEAEGVADGLLEGDANGDDDGLAEGVMVGFATGEGVGASGQMPPLNTYVSTPVNDSSASHSFPQPQLMPSKSINFASLSAS